MSLGCVHTSLGSFGLDQKKETIHLVLVHCVFILPPDLKIRNETKQNKCFCRVYFAPELGKHPKPCCVLG